MISIPEKWLFWRQMCWSFSSFVIKSGCTSKESWDCGDTMLSSGERRRKPTGTQSLKFCDKTWTVQNRRLKGFHYSVLHSLEPMSFSVITTWAPDFQNFKNWIWDLEENTRVWQELGSWTCFWIWGVLSLLWKRDSDRASTATSAITGNPETTKRSVQTRAMLHPKWTTPTDLVPGFLPMVMDSATSVLKKTSFQWTTVI